LNRRSDHESVYFDCLADGAGLGAHWQRWMKGMIASVGTRRFVAPHQDICFSIQ